MSSEFDRGVMSVASWHQQETVTAINSTAELIRLATEAGAWPTHIHEEPLIASVSNLPTPCRAVVAGYPLHESRVVGVVRDRYTWLPTETRDELILAAGAAGGRPVGGFSLRDGSRTVAVFEVGDGAIKTYLNIADSYDGTIHLTCGMSAVRVVCSNTMASWLRTDGHRAAKVRHTASLPDKVGIMSANIAQAITLGDSVRKVYEEALNTDKRDKVQAAFDALFPTAPDGSTANAETRANNARAEAVSAMSLPCNAEGGNVATVWNAATYLVDRHPDGSARALRGGEALDSLMFGTRGARVAEIQHIVEVCMRDGTVVGMTVAEAHGVGAVDGAAILDMML